MTQIVTPRTNDEAAVRRVAEAFSPETIDALLKDAKATGTPVDGVDGLLNQMTKAVLERALQVEMTDHLGYEVGDPAGHGTGNSRNGRSTKTVSTRNGPVDIEVPRDRNGSFEPMIVPKHARRIGNLDDTILSLYSRGMTTRDIEAHLGEVYGVHASRELISNVTEVVVDEIKAWQSRPLDEVYPILYVDGLRIRVKDNGVVTTKVAYLAVGVDVDGRKHALGCWIQDTEGAKFWQKVLADLRNRGVRDILIVCCDGLTGLPEAVVAVFPETVVQTCVVHVIRNAMRFVSYNDRKAVVRAMKEIYTAPTLEAAELGLAAFDKNFGTQYPGAVDVWRHAWAEFIPFLDYPPELRKIVYTTNAIESMNFQLRKITKNRGHFPDRDAAMKLLYLGLRNISSHRGGESGTGTHGWKIALNSLVNLFPGRLPF
ncbi:MULTISPECIES: IS256 family transposase [unclassified Pseudofrankia]|uniref:IS256 family transposase n=1 Tax=unclassified Pseudofrankia TaxID=2994372 RepID=UPI0008D958F9|nr:MULTISPECIES: IS256 family transposase [unclassified Pseudofrankia]MDT3447057.1 IS256 family transposase [Pseudofrankia sp. BMG5.37]OHV51225.1 transposase [Pseudofrankia sp. BMG5.36]